MKSTMLICIITNLFSSKLTLSFTIHTARVSSHVPDRLQRDGFWLAAQTRLWAHKLKFVSKVMTLMKHH